MKENLSSKTPTLKRRDFLKLSLFVSISALTWACRASLSGLSSEEEGDEDILVIGAGIAGLAAARQLTSLGYRVTVIEGRDRIGGRVWTDNSFGVPIDLGASWIEGTRRNPITELRDEFGIKTIETDFEEVIVYDQDGEEVNDTTLAKMEEMFEDLVEEVFEYTEELDNDISYGNAIKKVLEDYDLSDFEEQLLNWVIDENIVSDLAADLDNLSSWYIDEDEEFGGSSEIFPGGYVQIAEGLAQGLDIRLGEIVQKISYDEDGVTIKTQNNSYSGDRAVVTLPLGILRAGKVKFSPPLPASKTGAMQRLKMGVLNKVVLQFPEVFWDEDAHFLGYLTDKKEALQGYLNLYPAYNKPLLMGFAGGSQGQGLENLSKTELIEQAMRGLRAMYGNNIPDPDKVLATQWSKDPFSLGSYSYVALGATQEDYKRMAEPVEGVLFFAGEATNHEYPSTVHGAFLSGMREAERIYDVS